ncbi:myristoylated alanine-rich C-kinase substrate-like [Lynx canadensis]|uniref:myristoylated alanine-rich C-kinase substrate-like n=1 Tax=Lynx canadensis TaxID=61383 RepID=UPI0011B0C7E4|nr:myristoylated alanine-rich C-kinase substrate-like [Lynx canadensis]
MPVRAQSPPHTAARCPETGTLQPTPRCNPPLPVPSALATTPSSPQSVAKEHLELAGKETRECGLGGRPQGLPGGGMTSEQSPVGGDAWMPSSAAFRADLALRALKPPSPAPRRVQHPSLAALSSSGSRRWQAGTLTPRRTSPSNFAPGEARTPQKTAYLVRESVARSFPRSAALAGNAARSLLLNSSRPGRGRSHLLGEAQSGRRRAGSRAAPARAGAAAAGSRCARAGGRRGGREAGRAGARAARALPLPPSLPRTLARPPPAASHSLTRALGPAAARRAPAPSGTARGKSRRVGAAPGGRGALPASAAAEVSRFGPGPRPRSAFRPRASALSGTQPIDYTRRRALQLFFSTFLASPRKAEP